MSRATSRNVLNVLGDLFAAAFPPTSWQAWRTALAAIFALPMSEAEADLYRRCTGRQARPVAPAREAWIIVGRRGGKSRIAALLAVYLACFRRYALAPGERGVVMVIATDRRQARVVFRYVLALLQAVPMLEALIERQTAEAIRLTNRINLEIHTSSFRSVRGYTVVGAVCDELAFWPTDDSANPDAEVIAALRPAMSTVPGALLVAISSSYARRGELWRAYQRHYGKDGDPVLVWQADTRTMNPTVPQAVIDQAYADDEASARAEYGAEFRADLEAFVSREAIDAAVIPDRLELPPLADVEYRAFVDPSGGSGADSMTLAIAHRDGDRILLDVIREKRPPFSPEAVVAEFVETLKAYRCYRVIGDRWGGEFVREPLRKAGITYDLSDKSKSDLYLSFLPLLNSARVELLDVPRLRAQLAGLERRTARGGKDTIDHGPNMHDDLINAAAGAVTLFDRAATALRLLNVDPAPTAGESVREFQARMEAEDAQRMRESAEEIARTIAANGAWFPGD